MPGWVHESYSGRLAKRIQTWLSSIELGVITSNKDTAALVSEIVNVGRPQLDFPGVPGTMMADQSFKYQGFPELVIEVAYSQKPADLHARAADYIKWSRGKIQTVVGVDLFEIWCDRRRRQPKRSPAAISIWRAEIDESTGEARISPSKSVINQV